MDAGLGIADMLAGLGMSPPAAVGCMFETVGMTPEGTPFGDSALIEDCPVGTLGLAAFGKFTLLLKGNSSLYRMAIGFCRRCPKDKTDCPAHLCQPEATEQYSVAAYRISAAENQERLAHLGAEDRLHDLRPVLGHWPLYWQNLRQRCHRQWSRHRLVREPLRAF